jgi:hypothetical protein
MPDQTIRHRQLSLNALRPCAENKKNAYQDPSVEPTEAWLSLTHCTIPFPEDVFCHIWKETENASQETFPKPTVRSPERQTQPVSGVGTTTNKNSFPTDSSRRADTPQQTGIRSGAHPSPVFHPSAPEMPL